VVGEGGTDRDTPLFAPRITRSPTAGSSAAARFPNGAKRAWRTTACSFWTSCGKFQRHVLDVLRQPLEDGEHCHNLSRDSVDGQFLKLVPTGWSSVSCWK